MGVTVSGNNIAIDSGSVVSAPVGNIYAPGMVIQQVYVRSDVRTTYSTPIGTSGTEVSVLNASITPKFSNSKILVNYTVCGERNHDVLWRLYRVIWTPANALVSATVIGTNTGNANRWSGWATDGYGSDDSTTPRTKHLVYYDTPATTLGNRVEYRLLTSSSSGTAFTFYLNRTVSSTGTDGQEVGISQTLLQEIAQ